MDEDKLQCDANAPAVRGAFLEPKLSQTSTAACATKKQATSGRLDPR